MNRPPSAPTAPAIPITAPEMRRARSSAAVSSAPAAIATRAWPRKIAGIILYVDPFPSPLSTNSSTNPAVNRASESIADAAITTPVATPMPMKFQKVTRAPPRRSASLPP